MLMAATDYPFLEILGTMILFFAWLAWIWIAISILTDLFRRHDLGGWTKAFWVVGIILLPFLGVLLYLGTQGKGMGERNVAAAKAQRAQFDDYVRDVAGDPTVQIEKAKALLDSGAIDQGEFDRLKAKALA